MKVITLGNGFIAQHLPYETSSFHMTSNKDHIEWFINIHKPDVIVNCIGKTGRPNVDWCESHKEETAIANTAIPILIAEACGKHSIQMIHIGSGCVYFGESPNFHYLQGNGTPWPDYAPDAPYKIFCTPGIKVDDGWKETDFANPQSFYSKTKYAADLAIGDMSHVTNLRIRMPISKQDTSRNLINKLRGYQQIINIPNSVTFMSDFTRCVDWAIRGHHTGTFHVVNPDTLTATDIMREYQKYVPEHTFDIISEKQLDGITTAKRSNCILNTDKLHFAGCPMTPAKEALQQCMVEYMGRQHVQ